MISFAQKLEAAKGYFCLAHFPESVKTYFHLISNVKASSNELVLNIKDLLFKPSSLTLKLRDIPKSEDLNSQFKSEYDLLVTARGKGKSEKPLALSDYKILGSLVEGISGHEFSHVSPLISKILNKLESENLNFFLQEVFAGAVNEDPLQITHRLKNILTLQKIEHVIDVKCGLKQGEFKAAEEAKGISKFMTALYQARIEEKKDRFFQTLKVYAINISEWFRMNFALAFAVNDIGGEVEDPSQATMRVMMLSTLWANITVWLLSLNASLGSIALTSLVVGGGVVVGSAALFAYNKWLKPVPSSCAPFNHKSNEIILNQTKRVVGRVEETYKVKQALDANQAVMIVGSPGVGKTAIIDQITRKMTDKSVLSGNATDFDPSKQSKQGKNITDYVTKFTKVFKGNEKNVVLCFDEAHTAMQKGCGLGDRLKTLIHKDPGGFPNVIFLTTKDEFDKYLTDSALRRRFKIISIEETDDKKTALILLNMADNDNPDIEISPDVFNKIYKLSKEHFPNKKQPALAITLLEKAFAKVKNPNQNSDIAIKLEELKEERLGLTLTYQREFGEGSQIFSSVCKKLKEALDSLDTQIEAKQIELENEKNKFASYEKLIEKRKKLETEIHKMAIEIDKGKVKEDFIKEFILKQYYMKPALETIIKTKQSEFTEPVKIDQALIEKIVAEEVADMKKSEEEKDKKEQNPLPQAIKKLKQNITELAMRHASGDLTEKEVKDFKIKVEITLPALEQAMAD
jgi:hypothetical protein